MRPWLVLPVITLASLALRATPHRTLASGTATAEVRRVQAHFDSVLHELGASDPARWTPAQRTARARILAELATYRDRGAFPQNRDFPGLAVPYFIDRESGVRCAVAHLMTTTGAGALAERVAAGDNNVWVSELSTNIAFNHWLTSNGLTVAEAARIQVPYVMDDSRTATVFGSSNRAYAVGTVAVAMPAALTALWNARGNADGHRRSGVVLGVTSSALALAFGGLALGDQQAPAYVAPVSLLSSAIGGWLSVRSLSRHGTAVAQRRDGALARVQVAPMITPRAGSAGLHLSMTF
jgi:hypothetical protein